MFGASIPSVRHAVSTREAKAHGWLLTWVSAAPRLQPSSGVAVEKSIRNGPLVADTLQLDEN